MFLISGENELSKGVAMGIISKFFSKQIKKSLNDIINDKKYNTTQDVQSKLLLLNGANIGNWDDLKQANLFKKLKDNGEIFVYRNPFDAVHIFLLDPNKKTIYGKWFWSPIEKNTALEVLEEILANS